MAITTKELIHAHEWRYATKKFDSTKKIGLSDWNALERTLILTPSSYGLQPWKFLVIADQEIRKKLRAASWNQAQVVDCSHYVVMLGKKEITEKDISKLLQKTAEIRKIDPTILERPKKTMIDDLVKGPRSQRIQEWAARQVYIALGNLMTSAALLGIDTCPMEGIDPAKYDEILGLTNSEFQTLVACAIGYRSIEDKN